MPANSLFILQNQAEIFKTITSLKLSLNPSGTDNPSLSPLVFLCFIHAFFIALFSHFEEPEFHKGKYCVSPLPLLPGIRTTAEVI